MRFRQIGIPAYGPFTGFELALPPGGADLHLIYGPNEAGKSSLLRAIRDLLYGIQARTPDSFRHEYKDLRIAASLEAGDGRQLSFQRRKGRSRTLLDEHGNPLEDDALAPFLGAVDRDFFTSVFGLGAEELRNGAQALLEGQGDLGQALFSASLAGTPVHRILDALDAEARTLFDGRSRTQVSLRPAVEEYEALLRQSREQSVRPETWTGVLANQDQARQAVAELDQGLRQRRDRRDWLQRCRDALPTLGRLAASEARLGELPATPDLDRAFLESTRASLAERDQRCQDLQRLAQRIEASESRVAASRPDPAVLARDGAINAVHAALGLYRQWREDCVGLEQDRERAAAAVESGLRRLGLEADFDSVEALRVGAAEELALGQAAQALQTARAESAAAGAEQARLQRDLARLVAEQSAMVVGEVESLRTALASHRPALDAERRARTLGAELSALALKIEAARARLPGLPQSEEGLVRLAVPAAASIRRFEAEQREQQAAEVDARRRLNEIDEQAEDLQARLGALEDAGELPSVEHLMRVREARNQAWQRVLERWRAGEGPDAGESAAEAAEFQVRLAEADRLADLLRDAADRVSQAESLHRQLAESGRRRRRIEASLAQIAEAVQGAQAAWIQAWSGTGVTPRQPVEMLDWRETWAELVGLIEQARIRRQEADLAAAAVDAARAALAAHLPGSPDRALAALVEAAERLVQEADVVAGSRRQLERQQAGLAADLARLESGRADREDAERAALEHWQSVCRPLGLAPELPTEGIVELLALRRAVVDAHDEWVRASRVLDQRRRAIAEYQAELDRLAGELGLADAETEVRESALWATLERARTLAERHAQARAEMQRETEERDTLLAAEVDSGRRLEQARDRAGAADEAGLREVLEVLGQRLDLEQEAQRHRDALYAPARGMPLAGFIERVRGESADALVGEMESLAGEIQQLERQRDQAVRDLARADQERAGLEQAGADAADALQSARGLAARIRADAGRYLRLRLATHFLREQIETYRRENQGPLLRRAGELFSAMTRGSFDGLGTRFEGDDRPVLVGLRADTAVPVSGMSDGTRDQLYLALRLAAIESHQRAHEPMPLVLDDILVNFDDQRSLAVLPVLAELAEHTQVLLFTHHQHLLSLAGQALGTDRLVVHRLAAP